MEDQIFSSVDSALLDVLRCRAILPSFLLNQSTVFKELTPNEDRLIQAGVFSILGIGSTEYGISHFNIIEMELVVKNVLKKLPRFKYLIDLMEKERLKELLKEVSTKLNVRSDLETMIVVNNDSLSLQKCLYFNPCQERIPEENLCKIYRSIRRELNSRWKRPVFLYDKIAGLKSHVERLMKELDESNLTFLVTSKFLKKNTILQKMREMLRIAKKTIMLMISFYDPRLTIFPQVFKEQLDSNPSLEIKLLLRDEDENKKLVLDIKKRLDEELKMRFSYAFFDIKRERGRMHAKTLIVDNRELLVASANLTISSLKRNVETAIFTSDPRTVRRASDFFNRLWSEVEKNPNL